MADTNEKKVVVPETGEVKTEVTPVKVTPEVKPKIVKKPKTKKVETEEMSFVPELGTTVPTSKLSEILK